MSREQPLRPDVPGGDAGRNRGGLNNTPIRDAKPPRPRGGVRRTRGWGGARGAIWGIIKADAIKNTPKYPSESPVFWGTGLGARCSGSASRRDFRATDCPLGSGGWAEPPPYLGANLPVGEVRATGKLAFCSAEG